MVATNNESYVRLIKAIRHESKNVSNVTIKKNVLGTITNNGIYVDSIEDEIPRGDFLILETENDFQSGDRVLCVPVGGYLVVIGKVV